MVHVIGSKIWTLPRRGHEGWFAGYLKALPVAAAHSFARQRLALKRWEEG